MDKPQDLITDFPALLDPSHLSDPSAGEVMLPSLVKTTGRTMLPLLMKMTGRTMLPLQMKARGKTILQS